MPTGAEARPRLGSGWAGARVALAVSVVRQRIAAAIGVELGADWREDVWAPETMLSTGTRPGRHKVYSVSVDRSGPTPPTARQRRPDGVGTHTALSIRFAYRLRADSQVDDYDAALDAEAAVIKGAMSTTGTDGPRVTWTQSTRQIAGDGTVYRGLVQIDAWHVMALD